ncbi:BLUF domain-containing protein [Derxia gummosa]|uniref:BLUF domain-containing protein n=1 Tax=Derxia gummosa DSM 723 TaxID=1121388 RepID=A0A8B6X8Z6_9BURK|nr:BLUF domain-containing protein [Derxia gummosa]
MTPLLLLLYVSSARTPLTDTELAALLVQSRDRNARLGLTGVLLYRDGNFMQALEGPADAVEQVWASIQRDPRHHDIITLMESTVQSRSFGSWSMGFINLDGSCAPQVCSCDSREPIKLDALHDNYGAVALLRGFRDHFSIGLRPA